MDSNKQLPSFGSAFKEAADILNIDDKLKQAIIAPNKIHRSELEILLDNGDTLKVPAWRSQHNNARGA